MIDFPGAKISSDTGFLLLREMDEWLSQRPKVTRTHQTFAGPNDSPTCLSGLGGLRGLQRRRPSPNRSCASALDRRPDIEAGQAPANSRLDSTEDPAHGSQENAAYNVYFGANCFHPLFAFTSDGACLGAKLRLFAGGGRFFIPPPTIHRSAR